MTAMRVLHEEPPIAERIYAKFPVRGAGVIFAWGDVIYNPRRVSVSPELVAHEAAHGQRQSQCGGPEAWWDRYILDDDFRLSEEVIAHRVEFVVALRALRSSGRWTSARGRFLFRHVARRLANPIYQYKKRLTVDRARHLLREYDELARKQEAA